MEISENSLLSRIAHLCGWPPHLVVGSLLFNLGGRIKELEGCDPSKPGGETPGHLGDGL